ncbi:MAG: TetR/AcrR family transcriptional regulator [Lachnospiraceae bacterium]|nr:TetR/AcrR family transcriptional regulator [Lachnospiraceae bacterium]
MAVPDKTIDPRILSSAREEFLEKGFEKASLKDICSKADVTTGALYKRYKGKDDLFSAVVRQTVNDLSEIVEEKMARDLKQLSDHELYAEWDMNEEYMMWWFDYLYERYDDFLLLLKYSTGSSYSDFANDWVEKMNQSTYDYYEEAYRRGIAEKYVSRAEMHILISAFWTCIYEPFIHGMKKEEIANHSKLVCKFMNWHKALEFHLIK